MKNLALFWVLIFLFSGNSYLSAQMVTIDEAANIAARYIQMISDRYGSWAGSSEARPGPMQELKMGDKLIGYYCNAMPDGFLIVPLRRELGAVKASSDKGRFDPTSEKGIIGFVKYIMSGQINTIESNFRNIERVTVEELESLCEFSYRQAWNDIDRYVPGSFSKDTLLKWNYAQGQIMLNTFWEQGPPYNNACPDLGCTTTTNGRALAGCTAVAMAQIMRHWAWPLYLSGSSFWYDWEHMSDQVFSYSPQIEQDAVAALCYHAASLSGSNFGCDITTGDFELTKDAFKNFFFYSNTVNLLRRRHYKWEDWWNMMKAQLNANRPILYFVVAHAIVCDGWREWGSIEYHMNYGWGVEPYTTWYLFDNLHWGDFDMEQMITNIFPSTALGNSPIGNYPGGIVRYFDVDAQSSGAIFEPGNWLQLGKKVKIRGTGTGFIFNGTSAEPTLIYTDGVRNKGIVVKNGTMKLINGGEAIITQ